MIDDTGIEGLSRYLQVGLCKQRRKNQRLLIIDKPIFRYGIGRQDVGQIFIDTQKVPNGVAILGDGKPTRPAIPLGYPQSCPPQ
jgi:hypothetical protein